MVIVILVSYNFYATVCKMCVFSGKAEKKKKKFVCGRLCIFRFGFKNRHLSFFLLH